LSLASSTCRICCRFSALTYQNGYVEIPLLEAFTRNPYFQKPWGSDIALMMKDPNARHAHIEMALQQAAVQERYSGVIKSMGWAFVPHVSVQDQINTYQHFQHV
jgi:hypothetical protein